MTRKIRQLKRILLQNLFVKAPSILSIPDEQKDSYVFGRTNAPRLYGDNSVNLARRDDVVGWDSKIILTLDYTINTRQARSQGGGLPLPRHVPNLV